MKSSIPPRPVRARSFIEAYTKGLTSEDLQRVFTRDAREAYKFFVRGADEEALAALPWHARLVTQAKAFFWAFTLKLSPARRAIYGLALLVSLLGMASLFRGFRFVGFPVTLGPIGLPIGLPMPTWADGTLSLFLGFLGVNLLVLLEVADRLSLKNDLEIARDIQKAMLPQAIYDNDGIQAFGLTRPANTVGGDFYDVMALPDGRVVVTLGDVAGKGSPAALLMALLLAMFRTLIDQGLEAAELAERLNVQVVRHSPPSRFITLFFATIDPVSGRVVYVNAGHTSGLLRRRNGAMQRLTGGGVALGMFEGSRYQAFETQMEPGDTLVLYSDGVTEAEDHKGQQFEEAGLERVIEVHAGDTPRDLAQAIVRVVEVHAQETYLADDLTLLVVKRSEVPIPVVVPPIPVSDV